ncbi:hypothetical protein EPO04_04255 [Patescibacteria group bacterium]|nr:MAG: hypothetical protein EPO04_04255 [Patescibacteria group bacterium]
MKHFTVNEIKIASYKKASVYDAVSGGSRPRIVFIHSKTNQKFFFKTYTHNPREVWAEALASHIGQLTGIPTQKVTIKTAPLRLKEILIKHFPTKVDQNWTRVGTLARNIFPKDYEITYGSNIVGSIGNPLTLNQAESFIRDKYYAADDLLQSYAEMIVFDAFIGNMDRHHENWGISESKTYKQMVLFDQKNLASKRHFAPLFDHGSSLMFELSDQKVSQLNADDEALYRYILASKYSFLLDESGKSTNVFKVIEQEIASKSDWGKRFKNSAIKIVSIDLLSLSTLLIQMPTLPALEYNQKRRSLLYKSLLFRYNKIKSLL